jgi:ATP-dependent RNA helicase RhlE
LGRLKLADKRHAGIKCLVMVPTRELALQIKDAFIETGKGVGLNISAIFGGVEQDQQIRKLKEGVDILISTPGRMFDLISQGYIDITRLKTLVIDEADHMLDLGFYKDIKDVLRHVPRNRQTLFFSATINDRIKKLAYDVVKDAIRIQISPDNPVNRNIDHSVAFIEMDDKRFFLERLINEHPETRILVFVRTKVRAERVLKALERAGIHSETLHGGKEQSERLQVLSNFKAGKTRILIATDLSARGIDIQGVEYVVNYDMPEQPENYVHRVGRTGRGNKRGIAIAFCSKEELPLLNEIENYTGAKLAILEIDKASYLETITYTADESQNDWRSLLKEEDENPLNVSKKKNKSSKR